METITRTAHTHAYQVTITPEVIRDAALDVFEMLKREAVVTIRRTNPDAEVVDQKLVRGEGAEHARNMRLDEADPRCADQIWQVRTRFLTALPVDYT